MAAKFINTVLYLLLFLLAFLILIRYIKSKEGFANPPPASSEETYDLELIFRNYPLQKACDIYAKNYPTVVDSFIYDDAGEKRTEMKAKKEADAFLRDNMKLIICPFKLPDSKNLKTAYNFVMKLNNNLFVNAYSTLVYFTANLQIAVNNTRKQLAQMKSEGFITACSPEEIENKNIVPLQCIPLEEITVAQKQAIDAVDRFDMEERVSQKQEIMEKIIKLRKNLDNFKVSFLRSSQKDQRYYQKEVEKSKARVALYTNPPPEFFMFGGSKEQADKKLQEWKGYLEEMETELQKYTSYIELAPLSIQQLVSLNEKLQKELDGEADTIENGDIGIPKS